MIKRSRSRSSEFLLRMVLSFVLLVCLQLLSQSNSDYGAIKDDHSRDRDSDFLTLPASPRVIMSVAIFTALETRAESHNGRFDN